MAEPYPLDVNVALPLKCAELPPNCEYGDIITFPLVQGKPQRMREPAWASIHPNQKYVLVKTNAL